MQFSDILIDSMSTARQCIRIGHSIDLKKQQFSLLLFDEQLKSNIFFFSCFTTRSLLLATRLTGLEGTWPGIGQRQS